MMGRLGVILLCLLFFTQCQKGVEKEREIGYRGKARSNPYLAFERFVQQYDGQELVVQSSWPALDESEAMILFTADQLSSRFSIDQVQEWVEQGGHAVILLDHAEMYSSDWDRWQSAAELPEPLLEWAKRMDWKLESSSSEEKYDTVELQEEPYEVDLASRTLVRDEDDKARALLMQELGDGAVTWVSDARLLRNRWIDQKEHIELLSHLIEVKRDGKMIFLRGVGISFFGLLWQKGWMVLLALAVWILAWLLRHMPRFGPLQQGLREDQIRAYDHHLEMIGDFHWRLDHGDSLLQPLRHEVQELCHHWQAKNGRLDERLFDVMAARANLPVDRVERAMTDPKARDNMIFTRMVADLQHIRKAFA